MIDSIDIQCPPFNFFYSTKTPAGNKTCSATAACESIYVPGTTPKYTNPKAFNNDGGFWPPSANLSAYCVYTHDAHLPGFRQLSQKLHNTTRISPVSAPFSTTPRRSAPRICALAPLSCPNVPLLLSHVML